MTGRSPLITLNNGVTMPALGLGVLNRSAPERTADAVACAIAKGYRLIDTAASYANERLVGDAWLVGRVTGQEYAKRDAYPEHTDQRYPREPWFVRHDVAAYGVVLDAHGKIAWGRTDIGDDPIVAVLTAQVSDAHAADARQRTSSLAASWAGYGVVSGRSPPSPRSIRAGAVVPILKWSTR